MTVTLLSCIFLLRDWLNTASNPRDVMFFYRNIWIFKIDDTHTYAIYTRERAKHMLKEFAGLLCSSLNTTYSCYSHYIVNEIEDENTIYIYHSLKHSWNGNSAHSVYKSLSIQPLLNFEQSNHES